MSETLAERLWGRVDKKAPGGCWLWTGGTNSNGYGQIRNPKKCYVHRVVYELAVGPIPEGVEIDHICRVRLCCNPEHLRPVTHRQNLQNRTATRTSRTGIRGVTWNARTCRWRVRVRHDGRDYHGGYYESVDEAEGVAIALRNELFTHNTPDRLRELR